MCPRTHALLALVTVSAACSPTSPAADAGADLANPPPRSFRILVTGEEFAQTGYGFPPAPGQEVSFKDGWEVKYDRVLLTLGAIALSENPDTSPTDPSQTGQLVAQLDGPFAVDLVAGGRFPDGAAGLGVLTTQNKKGAAAFDSSARYAFSYALVKADPTAQQVNLDAAAQAAYATMVSAGYSAWMEGTATFKGTACRATTIPGQAAYDFTRLPRVVHFKFGWSIPTTFKNCLNPAIGMNVRGVQVKDNVAVDEAITFHLDHPFWEALTEDAPLRWDAIAARKSVAVAPGPATVDVTEADVKGVDFLAFQDAQGLRLPIRFCGAAQAGEPTSGQLRYDPTTVPVGAAGLKDLYDYMQYNTSTFGHLNADGLCFPSRDFPAP
jgi:hypothetical protein